MNANTVEDILREIRLSERVVNILENEGFKSIGEILIASRMYLQSIGLSDAEIRLLKTEVSRNDVNFQTASQLEVQMNREQLTFGCRSLDRIMRNGLNTGITEISGESGVGKSQICLQLSLMVQLPVGRGGLGKAAVFICTEDAFPSKRLFQLADVFTKRNGESNYLDNIFIEHMHDSEDLLKCVLSRLPNLMRQKSIGLIVIDSVAGVFRLSNAIDRASDMRKLAHGLKTTSTEHGCAVVCVNQVTSLMSNDHDDSSGLAKSTPSLGLVWSSLVTTRIQIDKTNDQYTIQKINQGGKIIEKSTTIRKCSVIFSPDLPRTSCTFMITADGVVDVPVA